MAKKSQRVGGQFEDLINATNANYDLRGLAMFVRQHEEVKTNKHWDAAAKKHVITNAYYKGKGGLDYAGIVAGRYVSFDAKSAADRLPFKNIEPHQIELMKKIEKYKGDAFLLVYIRNSNAVYLVPAYYIVPLYEAWHENYLKNKATGKKERYEGSASLNVANLNENAFVVMPSMLGFVDWLPAYKKMVQYKLEAHI